MANSRLMAHRDKSQSPEFTVGIDAKRTLVDKRSRPNLQQMTQLRLERVAFAAMHGPHLLLYLPPDVWP